MKHLNLKYGTKDEKTLFFHVVNKGEWDQDPDVDALKKAHSSATVALLQNGMASPELGKDEYNGCSDAMMLSTHRVSDRNADFCNFGSTEILQAGHYSQIRRSLIKFDLTGIPADAKIKAAYLKLYTYTSPGRGGKGWSHNKLVYRVLRPWGEGVGIGSRYDKKKGHVRAGECSWLMARYPDDPWGKPGCSQPGVDRSASPAATSICDEANKVKGKPQQVHKVWLKWTLTKLAQDWVAHPDKNFGVLLDVKDTDLKTWHDKIGKGCMYFRSSNYKDKTFRPRLVIAFEK